MLAPSRPTPAPAFVLNGTVWSTHQVAASHTLSHSSHSPHRPKASGGHFSDANKTRHIHLVQPSAVPVHPLPHRNAQEHLRVTHSVWWCRVYGLDNRGTTTGFRAVSLRLLGSSACKRDAIRAAIRAEGGSEGGEGVWGGGGGGACSRLAA